jgi:transketolase
MTDTGHGQTRRPGAGVPHDASGARTDPATLAELRRQARAARSSVIDMAASPVGCHLGGSLSVVEILVAAYHLADQADGVEVVLSKGHAAAALYAVLHARGSLAHDPAPSYGAAGSPFTGHPGPGVPGVRFPTGSLGHGLAYAVGWALSGSLTGRPGGAIAVVGDGELQEGLVWEALQVAQARWAANLTVVVDLNGGQNDGPVAAISPLTDLPARFASFGFAPTEVDGHDIERLLTAMTPAGPPRAVLARTTKANGIPTLAGDPRSHYVHISPRRAAAWKAVLR